jgi:hypothetical protein
VRAALLERDEALQKARKDAVAVQVAAAKSERELASARAQLQQNRATLEGARSWPSQAEEKAKEAELHRTSLADRAASLASTEEQLQREQDTRQQVGAQLQQERAALTKARVTLECERLAREEAEGRLQQERASLEGAQATLTQRDEEISRLNGELTQISVSHEDLRQSLKEQEATVPSLRQAAEDARQALEAEKKQVKVELVFACPPLVHSTCLGSAPDLCFSFMVSRLADCPGKLDDPGSGCADGLQLLATGVGRAAGRSPRGLPGSRGGRGTSREFDGEPPPRPWWARHACAVSFTWASRRRLVWWPPTIR